ncbi:MAG: hypothetical protein ABJN75_01800 [Hoeflea sp.]|uniref:hypothetical protein n=1 Tax=Hoeflea sp. TaxID=1940281 RepID=UPI003299E59F
MPKLPMQVPNIVKRVLESSPSDLRLLAHRLHDHATEDRMSPADVKSSLAQLGYDDIADFCRDLDMPSHVAEHWQRFGVSGEMRQVFRLMIKQRDRFAAAVAEFETITHVGLEQFLKGRGVL